MELSVVIPVFNEAESLPELIERVVAVCAGAPEKIEFEILLVDDGSFDGSREIIKDAARADSRVRGVFLAKNGGQQAALLAGFATSGGKFCITLDADLQNPPEEILKILRALRAGSDLVGSVRTCRHDTSFRVVCSRIANFGVRILLGAGTFPMRDYGCMLRGYARAVADALCENFCDTRFIYLSILAQAFAKSPTELEVSHAKRAGGVSKYAGTKLLRALFAMLVCAKRVSIIRNAKGRF